ncbi:MAG: succinate dehydrogenase [Polyangiales bacterium]
MHAEQTAHGSIRNFVYQRLATILALAPLGVWVVVHVWSNLQAFNGAEAWQSSVTQKNPVSTAITCAVVFLPLILHTIWGLGRVTKSRVNASNYPYFGNIRYLLQRASALGVLLFIGAHVWLAFLRPRFVEGHVEAFADIAHEMRHHGPTLVVYLLGTLGVAYHLGNGLVTSAMAFGVGTTAQSQKRVERFGLLAFAVLLAISWGAIFGLYRAG